MRTISVNITAIKLHRLVVDADTQTVTVSYTLLDDQGSVYRHGEAARTFAQLPAGYALQLRNLRDALLADLKALHVD